MPHRDDVMLDGVDLFKDFYVLLEREAGFPHLRVTDFASGAVAPHRVPGAGLHRVLRAPTASSTRRSTASPTSRRSRPPSVYDYDPVTRERTLLKQEAVLGGYDPSRYTVEITQATARRRREGPDVAGLPQGPAKRDGEQPRPALRLRLVRRVRGRPTSTRTCSAWSTAASSTPWPTSAAAASWARSGTTTGAC